MRHSGGVPPVPPPPAPGRPDAGHLLTPGLLAFLVVDVVLVVVAVVMLVGALSAADGTTPAATGPRVTPAATVPTPASPAPASPAPSPSTSASVPTETLTTFASPSRNIGCEITAAGVRCTIAKSDEKKPKDSSCPKGTTWGRVLTLTPSGADKPCEKGKPKAAAATTPVLNYERSTAAHGYTCTSTTAGITCRHDESGRGFSLARAGSQLF